MSKVLIKANLVQEGQVPYLWQTKGLWIENRLFYRENKTKVEIQFGEKKIKMIRKVESIFTIEMTFIEHQKTDCLYHLLEYQKIVNFSIWTHKIIRKPQYWLIKYELETQGRHQFWIEYEVEI